MKKITALLILICMISSASFAAPLAVCNSELGSVDVSGTVSESEGVVITTIIKKDENILPDNFSASVAFDELETDGKGSYNGQFLLPEYAERGVLYSVYTSGDENAGEFYYATEGEISACINALATASDENIDSILNQYVLEKNILGVSLSGDFSKYPTWSKKAMVELLGDSENITLTEIREIFDMANEAAFLLAGGEAQVKSALSENLLGNDVDTALPLDALAKMYAGNKSLPASGEKITETIAKNLRTATAVVSINSATRGKMRDVLESFNDILELELTGAYITYESDVNKALTGKDFTSVSEVRNAFETEILNLTTPPPTTETPIFGGSTGGGGASRPGSGSGVIELPTPESAPAQKASFKDIDAVPWAKVAINELYAQKIISGYNDDEYKPDNKVTRAEFTKLAVSLCDDLKMNSNIIFSDVSDKDWFAPYIDKAVANGLVSGMGENFVPNGNITREDAAVIIYRFLYKKITFSNSNSFADDNLISDYAKDAVAKLSGNKIINGMGNNTFMPKDTLTRAQAAVMIYSALCALK